MAGHGTQTKEAVTGLVSLIRSEAIHEAPSPNLTQSLRGCIAGVEISQTSSQPGATLQVRICGTRSSTYSNNDLVLRKSLKTVLLLSKSAVQFFYGGWKALLEAQLAAGPGHSLAKA